VESGRVTVNRRTGGWMVHLRRDKWQTGSSLSANLEESATGSSVASRCGVERSLMALGHRARLGRACTRVHETRPVLSSLSLASRLDLFACLRGGADNRSPALKRNSAMEFGVDRPVSPRDPLSPNNKCARNQRPTTVKASMKDISIARYGEIPAIPKGYSALCGNTL